MKIGIVLLLMLHYGCTIYETATGVVTEQNSEPPTTMKELNVPSSFTWRPSEPRDMSLEIVTVHGAAFPRTGVVSVYDSQNNLISQGTSGDQGRYRARITLASKDVIVEVKCGSITRRKQVAADQLGFIQIEM